MFSRSSDRTSRWLVPGIVLAGLAGTHAVSAVFSPPGDGDLGWQHWLGVQIVHSGLPHALGSESFAATGAPWVPQEWLFCTLLALATMHGAGWLFALAVGSCAIVALSCVALRCARSGAHPVATALVLVFVDVAMSQAFGVRVQVVGWAMLAAFLLALELPVRHRWAAIAIALVWANVHASALLAPVLAASAAAGSAIQRDRRGLANDALVAIGCAAAVCATPLGSALPEYAVSLMRSPIRHWIHEWQPSSVSDIAFGLGALPLMLLAAANLRRPSWRSIALALPFGYLAFAAVRNVPLAAIACAPLAATALTALLPSLGGWKVRAGRWIGAIAVSVVGLSACFGTAYAERGARDPRPLTAIRALAQLPGAHRLLCEDFAWCGPALDTLKIGVFVDGRADPYPLGVWRQYEAVIEARAGWGGIVRRHGVNALLVKRGGRLERAAATNGWQVAAVDGTALLLVRENAGASPGRTVPTRF